VSHHSLLTKLPVVALGMSLSRMCRKLREGDVVKFYREITHEDEED
jgi:hypothetical protein